MDRGLPDKRVPRPGRRCRARLPTRHRSRSSRPEWSSADPRPDAGMRSRSSVSARGAGVGRRRDRRPAHRSPRMVLDHRYRLAPVPGSGRPGSDGHRSSTRRLLQTVSRSARIGSWGIVHRLVHQRTGSRSSQSEDSKPRRPQGPTMASKQRRSDLNVRRRVVAPQDAMPGEPRRAPNHRLRYSRGNARHPQARSGTRH